MESIALWIRLSKMTAKEKIKIEIKIKKHLLLLTVERYNLPTYSFSELKLSIKIFYKM